MKGVRKMRTSILICAPDNPDILNLVKIFDEKEFMVETFSLSNFIDDKISKTLPDIVIYDDDLSIPFQTLIKSLMSNTILIGLLTPGKLDDKELEYILESGMHDYVYKPFDGDELLGRIKMQLSIRNSNSTFFE